MADKIAPLLAVKVTISLSGMVTPPELKSKETVASLVPLAGTPAAGLDDRTSSITGVTVTVVGGAVAPATEMLTVTGSRVGAVIGTEN